MIIKCNGVELVLNEEEAKHLINSKAFVEILKEVREINTICNEQCEECMIDIEGIYDCIF